MFCTVSLVNKKCVLVRSENRESEATAFRIIFLESSNYRKNSSHIFLEHSKFVEIYDVKISAFSGQIGSDFFVM